MHQFYMSSIWHVGGKTAIMLWECLFDGYVLLSGILCCVATSVR